MESSKSPPLVNFSADNQKMHDIVSKHDDPEVVSQFARKMGVDEKIIRACKKYVDDEDVEIYSFLKDSYTVENLALFPPLNMTRFERMLQSNSVVELIPLIRRSLSLENCQNIKKR